MSPINREREYARRRYEKWQTNLAVKRARRASQRRVATIAASAVAVVAVVVAAVLYFGGRGGNSTTVAATSSPSVAATSAAASASATAGPDPCPKPTVKSPATPEKFSAAPAASLAQGKSWKLTFVTTCGTIVVTMDGAKAPKAVANAIFLSSKGFWNGSPCHRLGDNGLDILQCGDPTGTGTGGPGYQFGPVENAPANGTYTRGEIAMARATSQDSQGSQFFFLYGTTQLPGGYTVFGTVTQGLDIIDKIAAGGLASVGSDGSSGPPARAISIVSTRVTPA